MVGTSAFILLPFAILPIISASTIKGPPIAHEKRISQVARLGSEVRLVCPVEGNPLPWIEWYREGEAIDFQWSRYRTNKRTLKIKDVDLADSGVFTCKGINGFGKEQIEISLVVINPADFPGLGAGEVPDVSPPRLPGEAGPARLVGRAGQQVRLACEAEGRPQPQVSWKKNGYNLLDKQGNKVLVIQSLMERDAGAYTCTASNLVGEVTREFILEIEKEMTDLSGPANKTVREGDTEVLECQVGTTEPPHIKWLRKLEPWEGGRRDAFEFDDNNYAVIDSSQEVLQQRNNKYLSRLQLTRVTQADSGMYICFVTNRKGTFNFKGAYLTVIPKSESLTPESPFVLILVISLSVVVVILLVSIIVCVVRRKQKESPSVQEPGEVRHNLMPPPAPPAPAPASSEVYTGKCEQPLPPPPTPTQWSHLYTDNSSYYDGNTYEVPHHHPGKTPPPTPFGTLLLPGYTSGYSAYPRADSGHPPSLASSHYGPQHPISVYHYHDRQPL